MNKKIDRFQIGKMWDPNFKDQMFYIVKNETPSGLIHWHDCFEIELILKGTCIEVVNGYQIPVAVGDAVLVTPTDLHELKDLNNLTIYTIMFDSDILDSELLNKVLMKDDSIISSSLNDEDFKYILTVLDYACQKFRKKEPDCERFIINSINQLLSIMLYQTGRTISKEKDLSIRTAAFYMKMHFRENPSLQEVAQSANLDEAYFSVKFHETMGVTFKKYLNDMKLNFASKSLVNTDSAVADICYESGFESLSHFHREFKKKYDYHRLNSESRRKVVKYKKTNSIKIFINILRRKFYVKLQVFKKVYVISGGALYALQLCRVQ